MSPQQRKHNKRRNGQPNQGRAADIWRPAPDLPDLTPITLAADAGALLRSLGDPPLPGRSVVAGHYLMAVVERAAGLATALAASANLLELAPNGRPDDQ
jgi:hypothetical protein